MGRRTHRSIECLAILATFVATWLAPTLTQAASTCASGGGHTICVTVPGSSLSGTTTITVTNSPNTGDVISSWIPSRNSAIQLIHEFAPSPSTNDYSFVWPTQKYLDASGTLRVDYSGTQVNVPVTLSNGNSADFQHSPNDWSSFLPGSWSGSQDPTVVAVGDGASNEVSSNAVANQLAAADPPLFLYLGDVYETGTFTEMRNQYGVSGLDVPGAGTLWGGSAPVTQPTIGNHEYPNKTAWIDYWHGRPLYTKFTFGGVLFLDLDNFQSLSSGSTEYKFVQSALNAPGVPPCVVAYWHTPAITGSTIKDSERALWALLANSGADLLLAGHAHTMAEYKPLDANFNVGTSGAHVVQLINGAGGHDFGGTLSDNRISWAKGKTSGVLALRLNGAHGGGTANSIGWTFKDVNNTVLRTGSVACGAGQTQNQAPVVNAGSDQTVTLPNSANLAGTATDDGLPNPPGTLSTTWSKASGPGTVTFGDPSALSTTATFSAAGPYVLRLTADDSALQTSDDLTVTVNATSGNLVGNPGFETDTSGWNVGDSDPGVALSRASGGHSGGWAALVANGGASTAARCKLQDAPNWVKTTSSGTYTGTMWVRADTPGATLTMKLREFNGSTLVAAGSTSVALTTSWQLVTVTYVPTMPGVSTLDFMALVSNAPVGKCFYADDLSLSLSS